MNLEILLIVRLLERLVRFTRETYRVDSKGYVMNLGSNGISGSVLQYLTLHINSDLRKNDYKGYITVMAIIGYNLGGLFTFSPRA